MAWPPVCSARSLQLHPQDRPLFTKPGRGGVVADAPEKRSYAGRKRLRLAQGIPGGRKLHDGQREHSAALPMLFAIRQINYATVDKNSLPVAKIDDSAPSASINPLTFFIDSEQIAMPSESMTTPAQIRAARALLDWSRHDLAKASGVGHSTIADYEKKRRPSILSENMRKIVAALYEHGVEFTEADKEHGAGVRWRKP